MSLKELFHSVATGPKRRRELLTPIGLAVFGSTLLIVVFGGLITDRVFTFPPLLPGAVGSVAGIPFLALGVILTGWCVWRFKRARGTPVPFNPPTELVATGPYLWVRNPMVTGVFLALFGAGFLLHSVSIVLLWTPAYIVVHVIELKLVEEPELERRFGESYSAYRARVPMFIPRPWRRAGSRQDCEPQPDTSTSDLP
jgi:protein-S-isoprenylcysteine O-methyltransferase Ste14